MYKSIKNKTGGQYPLKPRLSHTQSDPVNTILPEDSSIDDLMCELSIFEDCSVAHRKGKFITFDQVIFRRVRLNETDFPSLSLRDSILSNCDITNSIWSPSHWSRIEMQCCRMTGLNVTSGELQNVLFKDCKADLACFRFTKCRAVRFENCCLREADFQGADLRGCIFSGCDLQQAQFSQAKLEGMDIRDSRIEGIKVAPDNLRNVTVDIIQASYLAGLMGLIIK